MTFGAVRDASFVDGDLWVSYEVRGERSARRLPIEADVTGPVQAAPELGTARFLPLPGDRGLHAGVAISPESGRELRVIDLAPELPTVIARLALDEVADGVSRVFTIVDERVLLCISGPSPSADVLGVVDISNPEEPSLLGAVPGFLPLCRYPAGTDGVLRARGPLLARAVIGSRENSIGPSLSVYRVGESSATTLVDVGFNPSGASRYGLIRRAHFDGDVFVGDVENSRWLYTASVDGTVGPRGVPTGTQIFAVEDRVAYGTNGFDLRAYEIPTEGEPTLVAWTPGFTFGAGGRPPLQQASDPSWLAVSDESDDLVVLPRVSNGRGAPEVRGDGLLRGVVSVDGALALVGEERSGLTSSDAFPEPLGPADAPLLLPGDDRTLVVRNAAGDAAGFVPAVDLPAAAPCDGVFECDRQTMSRDSVPGVRLTDGGVISADRIPLPRALRHIDVGADGSGRCVVGGIDELGNLVRFPCRDGGGALVTLTTGVDLRAQSRVSPGGRVALLEPGRIRVWPSGAEPGSEPIVHLRSDEEAVDLAFGPERVWTIRRDAARGWLLESHLDGEVESSRALGDGPIPRLLAGARDALGVVALGRELRVVRGTAAEPGGAPVLAATLPVAPERATTLRDRLLLVAPDGVVELRLPCVPE